MAVSKKKKTTKQSSLIQKKSQLFWGTHLLEVVQARRLKTERKEEMRGVKKKQSHS